MLGDSFWYIKEQTYNYGLWDWFVPNKSMQFYTNIFILIAFTGGIMARVTVEDCLEKIPNRFTLVQIAAKRVRQVRDGADFSIKGSRNEDVVTALREVAAGKIHIKNEND